MSHLYDPFTLRGVTLRNRIGVSPMCQYSAGLDGMANDWHMAHIGARAAGGAGLIIMEATAVEPRGRISPADLGLWEDAQIAPLAQIVRFGQSQGAAMGVQIAHAGRKAGSAPPWKGGRPLSDAEGGWEPVGPSPIALDEAYRCPHELSIAEIQDVQAAFAATALRAAAAGFDFLEIHGAHGYLIHSFLSPLSNQRSDGYGGSFDNRARFAIETARAVRLAWPEHLPLGIRLSCTDWIEGGWSLEESVALASLLKQEGVDLVDCSSGGTVHKVKVPVGAGYQVPFAEAVRHGAGIPTAAVGMITQPMQADEIVRNGRADVVLLGREWLRDPSWAIHAALALGQRELVRVPEQYLRAY
jgi:2,4-dienoyl-CoA reductase-like NADH-dependent reductase (Old Yellow Enzyme family)